MEHDTGPSYRVYGPRELQSIAPVSLRASCPPPRKGVGWSGILFVVVLGATLSGATLGAQRFLDREASRRHVATQADVVAEPPPAPVAIAAGAAGAASDPAPPPASTATTTTTTTPDAKPKVAKRRRSKHASSTSASASAAIEEPPPNPYAEDAIDLRFIDRGSRSRP